MRAGRWRGLKWRRYARAKAHVWPSAIVMVNPQLQGAPEMPLTQRDKEVQTLPPCCAHKAFAHRIRQRSFHGRSKYSHTHGRHCLIQFPRKDAVPVVDHETVRMAARQGFPKLLESPLGRRMGGDVVMQNLPTTQFHDHECI